MTESERAILDRLELKLDVMIYMANGMSRSDAEARVYLPRIAELTRECRAVLRESRQLTVLEE